MKKLRAISYIFAVLSMVFLIIAILISTGTLGSSTGFLDLTNIVAIYVLGIAFVCSVVASVSALIYKLKLKSLVSDDSAIGVIVNDKREGGN